nr:hypothetical protein [Bacillus altitudinis]
MIHYDQFQLIQKALASTAREIEGIETGQSAKLTAAIENLAMAQNYIDHSEHAFLMKESYQHPCALKKRLSYPSINVTIECLNDSKVGG